MENSKNNYSEEKPKNVVKYDLEKIYSKILGKDYTSYKFNITIFPKNMTT